MRRLRDRTLWPNTMARVACGLQDNASVSTLQRGERRCSRASRPLSWQRDVTEHAPADAESRRQPHH